MTITHLVRVASLSLTLAACATEPTPSSDLTPTPAAIDYANHLESCDPGFATELTAFTSGQLDVAPTPSLECNVGESLLDSGCNFTRWWNWADFSARAACVTLGFPLCYATICVAQNL